MVAKVNPFLAFVTCDLIFFAFNVRFEHCAWSNSSPIALGSRTCLLFDSLSLFQDCPRNSVLTKKYFQKTRSVTVLMVCSVLSSIIMEMGHSLVLTFDFLYVIKNHSPFTGLVQWSRVVKVVGCLDWTRVINIWYAAVQDSAQSRSEQGQCLRRKLDFQPLIQDKLFCGISTVDFPDVKAPQLFPSSL